MKCKFFEATASYWKPR